jgi:phenylpropionate dioxygenase-like ring-hydroxylating dioxygenase large terminal subunit
MGPPGRKPVLPRYEALESLSDREWVEADDSSIGTGGPQIVDCNWLQHVENVLDPAHVVVLHSTHSGPQFGNTAVPLYDKLEVFVEQQVVRVQTTTVLRNGNSVVGGSEVAMPALRIVPNPTARGTAAQDSRDLDSIGWTVPIDDTHFRIYVAGRVMQTGALRAMRSKQGGKLWEELDTDAHRTYPGDYEAQVSQGAITLHSDEHLATSDRGIVALRRFYRAQAEIVEKGGDPAGVSFEPSASPIRFKSARHVIERT